MDMILASLLSAVIGLQSPAFPTNKLEMGEWKDVEGVSHRLPEPGARATVLLFMTVDCPIANRYAPEISRITKDYASKKTAFFRVYVDPTVGFEAIAQHGKDFSLTCPSIIDAKHELVKLVGASVTPEAAVIDDKGFLRYRGRIDDAYVEHGKPRTDTYRRDLRIALDEVLAGKPVTVRQTPAIGCGIPEF